MSQPGQYEVGQLYLGFTRNGLPVWTQPGGIGTLVYPQLPQVFPAQNQGYYQSPFTYPSLYVWGCGHPSNTAEVWEYYDPYEEDQMALITCPMCSYIQRIMPYSEYTNYEDTPIVIA